MIKYPTVCGSIIMGKSSHII